MSPTGRTCELTCRWPGRCWQLSGQGKAYVLWPAHFNIRLISVLQVEERQAREFRRASMTIEDIRRARQPINPAPRRTHTYMKIMLVTPQAKLLS